MIPVLNDFLPDDIGGSLGEKILFEIPIFFLIAPYFFICQFLLSRGNADAYRKDWQTMLLLNAIPAVGFSWWALRAYEGEQLTVLSRILPIIAGTFAGAVAASIVARIKRGWIAYRVRRRIICK